MSPSRKSAWSSTRRSRKGCMSILPSRSRNGDAGTHLCAESGLTGEVEGAAQGLNPLAHTGQAQGPRFAVALATRDKPLAVIGNDDPELIWPIRCERDRGLVSSGVFANVGQGFLDEPKQLERCERWELVG